MEKTIVKQLTASEAEVKLAMPFVASLHQGVLRTALDYKKAIEDFLSKTVDIKLILGLKDFSIEEEDKRLNYQQVVGN